MTKCGAVMLTKNYNPKIMTWAAIFAISLAFIGKFGALLQSIPVPVMGGILCLLFGSIAAVGMNTLIRHQVDLSEARNLVIVSVTLVFGIGGVLIGTGMGPEDFGVAKPRDFRGIGLDPRRFAQVLGAAHAVVQVHRLIATVGGQLIQHAQQR